MPNFGNAMLNLDAEKPNLDAEKPKLFQILPKFRVVFLNLDFAYNG